MRIYKIAQNEEDEEDKGESLTHEDNWNRNNYQWYLMDYMIDSDTPTEQLEVYYKDLYLGVEDSFEDAMQLSYDHFHGYAEPIDKKEMSTYDIIDKKFGYTDNPKLAGYIMESGKLVDLNRPHLDHRAVTIDGSTKSMQEFMADGNIRMSFQNGYAFFDISKNPTPIQLRVISNIVEMSSDGVEVSMRNGLGEYHDSNETYHSEDYIRKDFESYPNPQSVIGQIKSFFSKVYPSQFSKYLGAKEFRMYKLAQQYFQYWTDCVSSTAEQIDAMLDHPSNRKISYNTFLRYVGKDQLEEIFPYYNWGSNRNNGLKLKDDYHVSYNKSVYDNMACVYMVHSAIEYVFVSGREL